MPKPFVPIIMGSSSDLLEKDGQVKKSGHLETLAKRLNYWDIDNEFRVCSADKFAENLKVMIQEYETNPDLWLVYITVAGRRDALSGSTAGNYTQRPVIACPPPDEKYGPTVYITSFYLPSEDPVAFIPDPKNAADYAARIFGMYDITMAVKLNQNRTKVKEGIHADDIKVRKIKV